MADQQWEHCELGLVKWREDKKGRCYDCYIRYYGPTGQEIYHQIATIDTPFPYNPFAKAIGLLGAAGWEMVVVQHGNSYGGSSPHSGEGYDSAIVWNNRVAYFKRPTAQGRAVDEPKLML